MKRMTDMTNQFNKNSWVYVIVQHPESLPSIFGLHNEEDDISYIPFFKTRDDADDYFDDLVLKKRREYQVEAMLFEELISDAKSNGFSVFLMNGKGEILENIPVKFL